MSTALGASPRQPNIAYQPDLESYQNRTKERLATESLSKELPDGFPAALRSPLVWKGSNFGGRQDFVTVLAADDLEEIKEALRHFKGKAVSMDFLPESIVPRSQLIARSVASSLGQDLSRYFSFESPQREAPKALCGDA